MSLAKAPKDISAKPAKGSVIDPVDKQLQNEDVERKIKLYSIFQAFALNKYPTNQQIDETLNYALTHSPVDQDKLSGDGKKLIEDIRTIISTALEIVNAKNNDELLQSWLYSTRSDIDVKTHVGAVKSLAGEAKTSAPDSEKRKQDSDEALYHLRTLFKLVLTNSEVRKLLSDGGLIGRDLLARGASKAAGQLAPPSDQLALVDESAPRDEFIEDKRTEDILKGRIPGLGKKPKEAQEEVKQEVEAEKEEVEQEIQDIEHNQKLSAEEKEAKKKSLKDRLKSLSLSPENKAKLEGHRERARAFLLDEYFPKERRDQWLFRFKKVIIECQKHDDYQESLRWLMNMLKEYGIHGSKAFSSSDTSSIASDPALRSSLTQLRTILERFADGRSFDGIFAAFEKLSQAAKGDEGLRNWFKSVDAYLRRVLLDAGYVVEPACNNRAKELREEGRKFYDDKYRAQFDGLFRAIQEWTVGIRTDPLNAKFGDDWARLTKDLLFDNDGSLKFKRHLWTDIRSTILPQLIDKIGYVPIPRIEYTDESLDLVVENLVFSGRNVFPNIISIEAHNYLKFSPYSSIKDEHKHEIKLGLGQIQADMRDVAFYFRKKSGIPKITDSGLADVIVGGEGVTATVHIVSAPENDNTSIFRVKSCVVKVDSLKFSIRDSKHDFLYKTLKPLATGLVKRQIQKAIRDAITTGLEYVDGQLVGVKQRYSEARARAKAEAASDDGTSKMSEESRMKMLKGAFKPPTSDSASATTGSSHKRSSSHFKVVSDKRKSLLEGTGHPSGWVNRTLERNELAKTGEGWKSPVFDIVNSEVPANANTVNGTKVNVQA